MPKYPWTIAAALLGVALLATGFARPASAATGPRFSVDSWGTDKGLPEGAVISMVQSHDGYLWLGTLKGLARFDGIHFTVFTERNTPELGAGEIVHLFEDSEGNLWIGTQAAGVVLVKRGQVTSLTDLGWRGLDQHLVAAGQDPNGKVWLSSYDGHQAEYDTGRFHTTRIPTNGTVRTMALEKSGLLWLGMDWDPVAQKSELIHIDTRNLGPTNTSTHELLTNRLDFLYASPRGGRWQFVDGRIEKWLGTQPVGAPTPSPWGKSIRVTSACEDQQGNLIVGTLGAGVFWFDSQGESEQVSTNENLSNNSILSLLMDREGNLWVGTDGGGLNRVKRQVFDVLNETRGSTVQSVCEGGDGGLWVGINAGGENTTGAGLWKQGKFRGFGAEQGLTGVGTNVSASVLSVLVDHQQQVWAGSFGALFQFEPATSRFRPALAGFVVPTIFSDRENRLWFGSRNLGLLLWDGRAGTQFTTRDGLSTNDVRAIAEDREGNIWVGTRGGGLDRWRDGKFTAFHKSDGLPSENISSLYVDDQNVLWIGTAACGLARFQGNVWTNYTTQDGLASDSIGYLLEDGQGYLWLGSNTGLMRVRKQLLNDFAIGKTKAIACRVYGKGDGLPDNECTAGSQPGACRAHDGKLWFPTIKGLASVDPARLHPNTNPPPVLIEAVFINGHRQGTNGLGAGSPASITVPAGKEQLEFQYTSLNLADPERSRFRYQLEPYATNWVEAGDRRTAPYTKLPPGNFHFHVIACNEDGVWNNVGASIAITVLPPFWRKWWFVGSVSIALLGMVVGVVHYVSTQRLQRQLEGLRQQQALEKERARIARDIHDQVGANLTQVALLGEMVETDKDEPAEIESHGRQISQAARETSRALDEIVWTVNPSNDTVEGLINYVCKYAQEYLAVAGLRYRLDAPPQLPATPVSPEVRHNVFLAAKESINNVVKHARANSAWIRLRLDPGMFTLEIQDDGRGPGDVNSKAAQLRNGMRNMRKRMEDIGGTFYIGPAPEAGTLVRLTVPVGNGKPGAHPEGNRGSSAR